MGKWVKKKLGDLGFSFSGLSGKTIDDFGEGKPFIPYMNIFTNGKINSKQLEYVRIAENERQNKVEQGDWFFTTSSETPDAVGMTSVLVEDIGEAYLNSFCFGFRLYDKSEFEPEFVSYLFRSLELRKKISLFAQGSTRYNLPKQQMFNKLYISYPSSLSEQRRIASILSSADKVIDSTQKLIAKYKSIKQGMMEDWLKPKEGWKKVKLGECCEINPKTDTSKVLDDDIIVFVKMEDVSNDGFITSFNEKIYQSLQKKGFTVFQNDDVIFAKITPCMENGKGALVRGFDTKICMGSTEFHVIRACENISIDFIYQLTISKQFRLKAEMQMTGSAGQQRVPISFLEDYLFYIPDFSEQCRIASILSSIDKKIESEKKVLEKYKKIKKGLMEKLLNGE